MGKTYQNIPIATPDILREIVAEVSSNLASESSLDIAQVSFMHGTLLDINNELASKSKNPNEKGVTFPLVIFLYKSDEKFTDKYNSTLELEILICTGTKPTYSNDDRYTNNFLPILYPIYAELKEAIGRSKYFWGYKKTFLHTKTDLPHAGQESTNGPVAYNFSVPIDAIMLSNVNLKVSRPKCAYVAPNLCVLTPCPYGLELYDYTIFKNVTFDGIGTDTITASVNEYAYLYGSGGLPAPFAPEINFKGFGGYTEMDAPTAPATVPFTASFNIASLPGDGEYIGEIRFGTAHVQFYYKVEAGIIIKLMTLIVQDADFSVLCADFPAYPVTINSQVTIESYTTEPPVLDRYVLDIFGVNKVDTSFSLTDAHELETVTTLVHMGANQSITNTYYAGSHTAIENKSIYKTRCKTQF